MQNQFTAVMSERTDSELIDIVRKNRAEYQEEALAAAEAELAGRGIDPDQVLLSATVEGAEDVLDMEAPEERFTIYHKVGVAVLPIAVITIVNWSFNKLGQTVVTRTLPVPIAIVVMYAIYYRLRESGDEQMTKAYQSWVNKVVIGYLAAILLFGIGIYLFFMG